MWNEKMELIIASSGETMKYMPFCRHALLVSAYICPICAPPSPRLTTKMLGAILHNPAG
ncbi:hypothetical protein [Sporomusa sphaeroides]|uniref:hypothetical protein n=1 Tax=Sporomusa sphaeroides TaxID=47679 RepID=UPI00315873FA